MQLLLHHTSHCFPHAAHCDVISLCSHMPGAHDMAEFSIYCTIVAAGMIVEVSDRTHKQKYNESHILNMPISYYTEHVGTQL